MEIRNRLQEYVKEAPRISVTYFDNTEGHIIARENGLHEIMHLAYDNGGFY